MGIITVIIAASCVLSAGLAFLLRRGFGPDCHWTRTLAAGFAQTLLIVVGASIWEVVLRPEYDRSGSDGGFMTPLAGLIFGFLLVLFNLVANLVAASWVGRTE